MSSIGVRQGEDDAVAAPGMTVPRGPLDLGLLEMSEQTRTSDKPVVEPKE